MKTAMVLGANGQDGTFLCRHLLSRGYRVHAAGRGAAMSEGRLPRHAELTYRQVDLRETEPLAAFLTEARPDYVFYVAAVHNSAGLPYERVFGDMLLVNVRAVHTVLEYARASSTSPRIFYASSLKAFGEPPPEHIDESTPRKSHCLYAVTKNAARDLLEFYRRRHGVLASVGYLFNHESELRPEGFFMSKLVSSLAAALAGRPSPATFDSLEFYCDWGSADEYMGLVIDALERSPAEDFVLASGIVRHGRTFVRELFDRLGLDMAESILEREPGRAPGRPYQADVTKLERLVGRRPRVDIADLVMDLAERRASSLRRAR